MHTSWVLPRLSPALALLALASCGNRPQPLTPPLAPLATWHPTMQLAENALAAGAPTIALQVTDELLAADPRNTAALSRRGEALVAVGRPREAEAAYAKALDVDPHDVDALIGLGRLRLSQDAAAAEQLFAQAATRDPHNGTALNNLGVARDLQGHHPAAQDAYRRAIGEQPTAAAIQVNLGLSLALSGDPAGGVRLLRPLAQEPAATPRIRADLALALTLAGDTEEATAVLSQDLPPADVTNAVTGFQALRP